MIKKLIVISLAFIFALILVELIVGNILGFPKYGVKEKLIGMRSSKGHQNIYEPYSKYWSSYGNYETYKRNNLGLPGIDVDTGQESKYVCILGSSFVEDSYLNPASMSTSVLQDLLNKENRKYKVLNLGYNGCDPYDSYRRIGYYEYIYKPESVVLVLNSYIAGSYKLTDHPFEVTQNDFIKDNSIKTKINLLLKNNSSLARLLLTFIQETRGTGVVLPEDEKIDEYTLDLSDLQLCLNEFNKKYRNRFICVSIMNNEIINRRIKDYCDTNKIKFSYSNIMIPENQIIGDRHLNEKGNIELGKFIFNSFCKYNNLTQ